MNSYALVNVNTPFGGIKQSGQGKEMGEAALEGYAIFHLAIVSRLTTLTDTLTSKLFTSTLGSIFSVHWRNIVMWTCIIEEFIDGVHVRYHEIEPRSDLLEV